MKLFLFFDFMLFKFKLFFVQVSTATRLSDGGVVLVDVVEGASAQVLFHFIP